MKLIVDIPDNWEKELNQSKITFADVVDIDTIRNGIPLDKIRAEIKALSPEPTASDVVDGNPIKDAVWETIADVLAIIDKYKTGEGEE